MQINNAVDFGEMAIHGNPVSVISTAWAQPRYHIVG